jgi:hypothetical protein
MSPQDQGLLFNGQCHRRVLQLINIVFLLFEVLVYVRARTTPYVTGFQNELAHKTTIYIQCAACENQVSTSKVKVTAMDWTLCICHIISSAVKVCIQSIITSAFIMGFLFNLVLLITIKERRLTSLSSSKVKVTGRDLTYEFCIWFM